MCKELRAKISDDNPTEAHFYHPISKKPIYIICDGCHVLKLIRNTVAKQDMYDANNNLISWRFLECLVDFQEQGGVHPGTKIRRERLNFQQNITNVRLATQTLSESVSIALRYLKDDEHLLELENVEGTAKFCSIINEAFDLLNSREHYNKNKSKNGIDHDNITDITKRVNYIVEYIKNLKTEDGTLVIKSRRKTGFLGTIISIQNILRLYNTYVQIFNGYLLTYKLSQDHLENFFSAVRSKGGYSNNPTCYQFVSIFKKLLVHADVKESATANCVSLDDTNILHVLPEKPETSHSLNNDVNLVGLYNNLSDHENFYGKGTNKKYIDNVVVYLAGFVTRSVLKNTRCYVCPVLLTSDENYSTLLARKNRGNLIKPCLDIIKICKLVEKNFRAFYKSRKDIFKKLCNSIVQNIPDSLLPIKHSDDADEHRILILKQIVFKYLRIRVNYYETQKRQKTKKIRRVFTKMILFRKE